MSTTRIFPLWIVNTNLVAYKADVSEPGPSCNAVKLETCLSFLARSKLVRVLTDTMTSNVTYLLLLATNPFGWNALADTYLRFQILDHTSLELCPRPQL